VDPLLLQGAIVGAASIAANATTVIKAVVDKVKASGRSEMFQDIMDLQIAMMDLIQRQQELLTENDALRRQLQAANDRLAAKARVEFHHDAYWIPEDQGLFDGPYSRSELDVFGRLVRLKYWGLFEKQSKDPRVRFRDHKSEDEAAVPFSFLLTKCPRVASEVEPRIVEDRRPHVL
jgi:hypothetical protein